MYSVCWVRLKPASAIASRFAGLLTPIGALDAVATRALPRMKGVVRRRSKPSCLVSSQMIGVAIRIDPSLFKNRVIPIERRST